MDEIAVIRRFNRTVTHRIGALENHFLGRGRSLGASRVLFEIGKGGAAIRDLRRRLALDSGYLSRLLRTLEAQGLARVDRSTADARVRAVKLSRKGRAELQVLNRLSDDAAASLVASLSDKERADLQSAMVIVERLLRAGAVAIDIEDPSSPTAVDCLAQYYRELAERFEHGFDPGESISASPQELTPPQGYFVVARVNGSAAGCGALKCHDDFGEIKRMWVAPSSRGLGAGRRILSRLEELARHRKLPILRLETNRSLVEAQGLYRSCGYQEVAPFNAEPYAHHWFEKKL